MNAEMYKFYNENADFKDYVDKCIKTYGKDLDAVFDLKITGEYMNYILKYGKKEENNGGKEERE